MFHTPKISFIAALRDPHYGIKNGMNNLYRTKLFIENLNFLCNKHKLNSELIIVEWNPIKPGEFCKKAIIKKQSGFLTITWIEVPSKIHQQLPNSKKISIFEFIAKNIGIRRSHGKYILSTNPDILFSDSLIRYLAHTTLSPNYFYRIDRSDVQGYIPYKLSIKKRLGYCSKHIMRQHAFYGSVKPQNQGILHFWTRRQETRKLIEQYWSEEGFVAYPDGLHRNAAGDFFLMEKSNWFKLRGYAELYTHSHIDSILCWQAATFNLQQDILPDHLKLYHIDHDRKHRAAFPQTNWRIWWKKFQEFQTLTKPLVINNKNWGLNQIPFFKT